MSYDNAEPKVLKTLNSSGQVLDDAGNVISDTSDYWVQLYNQTEPKADKILKSDGTVVDSAGNLIQDTTEFNVKKYNQAEPTPAKYLHADGTIDENAGGGSADLEDNHQTTIDVSTYTQPVEVTPTSGKDGMKKNTVTLSNIPSGDATAYAWVSEDEDSPIIYTSFAIAPGNADNEKMLVFNIAPEMLYFVSAFLGSGGYETYSKNSDTSFTVNNGKRDIIFTRDSTKDFTLWQLSE